MIISEHLQIYLILKILKNKLTFNSYLHCSVYIHINWNLIKMWVYWSHMHAYTPIFLRENIWINLSCIPSPKGGSGHRHDGVGGVMTLSALCGSLSLLYLVAFKRDLRHDVRKCLIHTLFQQPSLTFALRILWVCQGFQWGAQVLQTNSHDSLWQKI